MKKIYLPIIALFYLFSFSGCEELGLDLRKVELTINGEISDIHTFDTYNIDYAVIWKREDILSYFDINDGAEILNFWVKDLRVLYQACDQIEAESIDLDMYVSQPNAAIAFMAFVANKKLSDLDATVDPREPRDLSIN